MSDATIGSRRRFLSGLGTAAMGTAALGGMYGVGVASASPVVPRPKALSLALSKGLSGTTLQDPPFSYIVLNRLGYGPAPFPGQTNADFESLGATDSERLANWLDEQLSDALPDDGLEARLADPAYQTLNKSLTQLWADHEVADVSYSERRRPALESEREKFLRATYSRYQLKERLAEFWHDHFNIYSRDNYAEHTFPDWDRNVIRRHMLGNFREFVEATAKHPAMLWYLDNYNNTRSEPNENYARELFELHTLGAENYQGLKRQRDVGLLSLSHPDEQDAPFFGSIAEAYVDDDVYGAGACFTGWRVRDSSNVDIGDTGEFYFEEASHARTGKSVLSGGFINIDPDGGLTDGHLVFDLVCYHPGTARHIAGKLCRRFVSENPPQQMIDDVAQVFYDNRYEPNQLELVVRALVLHPEFAAAPFPGKVKRPFDLLIFAMRAGAVDFTIRPDHRESDSLESRFDNSGQYPFRWQPPDGYPDESNFWTNSVALIQTWRAIEWLSRENEGSDGPELMPIISTTLAEFSADPQDHTPDKLIEFWMRRIFGYDPSGGWVGDPVHTAAVNFLVHPPELGQPPWPSDFPIGTGEQPGIDSNDWPYRWRDRLTGTVVLLLVSPYAMQR